MKIPDWWQALLLALAAYRTWRLIGLDTITAGWRHRVTRLGVWRNEDTIPFDYRAGLAEWLQCPWCLGSWCALVWWVVWELWPHGALVAAAPFAVASAVGLIAGRLE